MFLAIAVSFGAFGILKPVEVGGVTLPAFVIAFLETAASLLIGHVSSRLVSNSAPDESSLHHGFGWSGAASIALAYVAALTIVAGDAVAFLGQPTLINVFCFALDAAVVFLLLIISRSLGLVIAAVLAFLQAVVLLMCAVSMFIAAALLLIGFALAHIVRVALSVLAYPLLLLSRRREQRGISVIPVRSQAAAILVGILSGVLGLSAADGQQLSEEPQSSITVLVDLSTTWSNPASRLQNEEALKVVAKSVLHMASDLDPPIVIRYFPIGDLSLGRHALCEVLFLPKLSLSPQKKLAEVANPRALQGYLEASCLEKVLAQKQEAFTDITSALDNAARITDEQLGNFRAIIILSDLKEERRPGQKRQNLHLQGQRVLLLYRILDEDRRDPSKLEHFHNESR
jgi:hypothetical protein